MVLAPRLRQLPTGPWRTTAAGFVLQALGVAVDAGYHLVHPHGTAPLWAHLPIYLGALVVVAGAVGQVRRWPSDGIRRVALAGALVEVAALGWSVAVRAEANSFFLPAALGALGGATCFVILLRVWWAESRRAPARLAA